MRELICGVIMGFCCGIAIGTWVHAKILEVLDNQMDEGDQGE